MRIRVPGGGAIRSVVDGALRFAERATGADPSAAFDGLAAPESDPDAAPGLARLITACRDEARLSAFGRRALRWDIEQRLANLSRLREAEAADPAIRAEPVAAPLIITGMPRSGTTFLHRLLAADPAAFTVRGWETLFPYPPRTGPDRRAERLERQLRLFAFFAPELTRMHPVHAATPQECTEINAQIFRSLRFEATYDIPSYKAWLAEAGHAPAYRFHRRFLQHLQHQHRRPGHWVLKCPDHVFALAELRQTYPDARIVFLHRDPAYVLGSVARLTEALRLPFAHAIDRAAIGRQVLEDWTRGATILAHEAAHGTGALHLRFRDFVTRPLDTVRRIYAHFNMPWTEATERPMAALAAAVPDGGYGVYSYSFDEYGIKTAELRERFADYVRALDLPLEGPAVRARLRQTGAAALHPAGAIGPQTPFR